MTTIAIAARRNVAVLMAALILVATVGVVFSSGVARASTVFQSGEIFASVGNSTVDTYNPSTGGQIATLVDNLNEPYTNGSAFDAAGNFYVTDDINGTISEFSATGQLLPTFATGLVNPASLVFDQAGNLYVGQQGTPYIAEFSPTGLRMADIGPVATAETGDDWIDLSSDQCTFYYTTETQDIYRYNKCTNTQLPNFNQAPLPGSNAFELRILQNGDVLVADFDSVVMLDPSGNVVQTYPCSSLPGCGEGLWNVAIDPSGTSFWAGDLFSGNIWQVSIASGQVLQSISTNSPNLSGLSIDGEQEAAASPTVVSATPTSLTLNPISGDFSVPTPVSAVLTDSNTDAPIPGEQINFALNVNETCSATTDSTGTATCVITPGEPAQSYTLTASFPGDTTQSTPIATNDATTTFTVNPDGTMLTYTGPTTAVNGEPTTLSGTLTTDTPTPDTPLSAKDVTFTVGSQSCTDITDASGNASCTISPVHQPVTDVQVTTSFTGDAFDGPTSTSSPLTVTQPTTLTVNTAKGDYSDATTVSGRLTNSVDGTAISGEPVTLSLNGSETCTGTTDATGTASCSVTPNEAANTASTPNYPLTGSFSGDATLPLQLTGSTGSSQFVVMPEESTLTYTGPTKAQNSQPLTLSANLTRGYDAAAGETSDGDSLGRKAGRDDAGPAQRGPELHRDHGRCGERDLHHRLGEPASRSDPGHRVLRRRQLLRDRQ